MFLYKFYVYKNTLRKLSKAPIPFWGFIIAFVSTVVYLYFESDIMEEIAKVLQALLSSIIAIPIWIVVVGVYALFKMKSFGKWDGKKYTCNVPEHIKTFVFNANDNGRKIRLPVKYAPPHSLVEFKIEYHGGTGFIKLSNHENTVMGGDRNTQYSVEINKKSEVVIEVCVPPESREVIAAIYMVSFEKDGNIMLKIHNYKETDLYIARHEINA